VLFMAQSGTCWIDGVGPLPVTAPSSVAEVGDVVRQAVAKGQAIYPLGGQTMLDFGLPPKRPGVGVDLRNLTQVIDYPARDMTITVQAGITLAELQAVLATENQCLPIDVPHPDRATLGGALAANVSGPRRYGFGTLRDYVIGISVVNDEGEEVKAGGRVVKNVAGYDLCKLYIGSLGTLGIITQVTLKLKPRPEATRLMVYGCNTEELAGVLDWLTSSAARPSCIELLNQATAQSITHLGPKSGLLSAYSCLEMASYLDWALVIGVEGNAEAVAWQVNQLRGEQPGGAGTGLLQCAMPEAEGSWRALVDFPLLPERLLSFKVNLLPRAVAEFCAWAGAEFCRRTAPPADLLLKAHAGSGIVIGHVCGDLTLDLMGQMLKTLQEAASAAQGNLVILGCPTAWKATLPVWGQPRADAWLMREIKEKLDPRQLFNPGRFVDGI
jgi:glycolate oxidase FAD binding subunit